MRVPHPTCGWWSLGRRWSAARPRPTLVDVGDYANPEEEWRALLTGEHKGVLALRRAFRGLPADPRCKLCHAPFGGAGGFVLRPWFGPWERNAQLCKSCMRALTKAGVGGAEVGLSLLFADIRGSTGLGERLRPAEFSALLNAFYRLAAGAIIGNDGVVDKFVGDEAIGLFIPGFSGADHAAKAIAAGRAILAATGDPSASPDGAIPVGAGVHTGIAFVGSLGSSDQISDFTALGDPVNTTARLASLATAGELLVSVVAAEHAGFDGSGSERRTVEVRGREAGLDVYSVRAGT
jgi:adenylate cyclase